MNYFIVKAKCGHVGRNHYYEGNFPVIAADGKDAAKKVREYSRVKHAHNDAILSVMKVDKAEFENCKLEFKQQPYFSCFSKHAQVEHWDEIKDHVFPETDLAMERLRKRKPYYNTNKHKKGIRNKYKFDKYNKKYCYDDFDIIAA